MNSKFTAKESVKQIETILLSHIPKDNPIYLKLKCPKSVCGLVINERFLNLPPALAVPCYQHLAADLSLMIKQNPNRYNYDSVIMVCKVLKEKSSEKRSSLPNIIYQNPEDELFSDVAEASFEYSVANQCDGEAFDWDNDENLYEPFRKILLLSKERWVHIANTLKDII